MNAHFSLPRHIFLLAAIASLSLLSACGQRGPLYLQAQPAPLAVTLPASTTVPATPSY